jgi:hypothetical protein
MSHFLKKAFYVMALCLSFCVVGCGGNGGGGHHDSNNNSGSNACTGSNCTSDNSGDQSGSGDSGNGDSDSSNSGNSSGSGSTSTGESTVTPWDRTVPKDECSVWKYFPLFDQITFPLSQVEEDVVCNTSTPVTSLFITPSDWSVDSTNNTIYDLNQNFYDRLNASTGEKLFNPSGSASNYSVGDVPESEIKFSLGYAGVAPLPSDYSFFSLFKKYPSGTLVGGFSSISFIGNQKSFIDSYLNKLYSKGIFSSDDCQSTVSKETGTPLYQCSGTFEGANVSLTIANRDGQDAQTPTDIVLYAAPNNQSSETQTIIPPQ